MLFKNQSRFMYGTETVTYRSSDSASPVTVENALCGPLSFKQMRFYATLHLETQGLSIKLDQADLGVGVVPIRTGRIDRADGTKWKIQDIDGTHVTGVYLCTCSQQ
jgi:hypothetical protein